MADDDCIIIAGGNPGAEFLSTGSLEILGGGHQNLCTGIQPEEFVCPLKGQMVWHHEHTFLAQPQTLALHGGGDHLEGLARANFVSQQGITTVNHMGDGTQLMGPEADLRIHAHELQMASVVLSGADGVEALVVQGNQLIPAAGRLPNPVGKGIFDGLLFLLSQGGFLFVQDPLFLSIRTFNRIKDLDSFQIQCFLQNLIGVGPVSAVGDIGSHIVGAGLSLAGDLPLAGVLGVVELDVPALPVVRLEGFIHEILNVMGRNPCGTQSHIDFGSLQILGLGLLQIFHIYGETGIALR